MQTRCIGGRSSVRTLEALRQVTETVIGLCQDHYRPAAVEAVKNGQLVLAPADLTEESIDDTFRHLGTVESFGNTKGEPCYTSLETGRSGRNEDGSPHNGFLVIDPIERLVIDLIGLDGKTLLKTPLVRFATAEKVVF